MSSPAAGHEPSAPRAVPRIGSLASLVGAHPDALSAIFATGRATDPAELGDTPRGRVLALTQGSEVFLVVRPVLRALSDAGFPWRAKTFDHGGNSGQDVVFGRRVFRFQAERGPSQVDGLPALVLTYDAPVHKNPWPVRALRDELRTVGPGIAIGRAFFRTGGGGSGGSPGATAVPFLWFGLEPGG